jgi:hypothetical protein
MPPRRNILENPNMQFDRIIPALRRVIFGAFLSPIRLLPRLESLLRWPHNFLVNIIMSFPMNLSPRIPPQISNWYVAISKTSNDGDEILEKAKTGVRVGQFAGFCMMQTKGILEFRLQGVYAFVLNCGKVF